MKKAVATAAAVGLVLLLTAASPALRDLSDELRKVKARVDALEAQVAEIQTNIATLFLHAGETDTEQAAQDARLDAVEGLAQELDADLQAIEDALSGQTGVLVNSAGEVVGPVFLDVRDDPQLSRKLWVAVFRPEGNFLFEVRGGLYAAVESDLFYESTSCTGPPMVFKAAISSYHGAFVRQVKIGDEMWKGAGPDRSTTIRSSRTGSTGSCQSKNFSATMEEVVFAFNLNELGSGFTIK